MESGTKWKLSFSQKIFTSPIEHESFNPLKHGEYLTICIHWIFVEKNVYFFLSKVLKKKCISYPFGVRQSMVGEGCDEAGVHHPERISHALRHFSFSFSLLFAANIVRAIIICTINNPAAIIRANTIFMIITLGIIPLTSILFPIITFKAFMASSSVRSSPAKMILIRSLQATPNADRKMWIAAFPYIVHSQAADNINNND